MQADEAETHPVLVELVEKGMKAGGLATGVKTGRSFYSNFCRTYSYLM